MLFVVVRPVGMWARPLPCPSHPQVGRSSRLPSASHRQGQSVAARCCTTRRDNAHGIEEREVLNQWHPWSGRAVRVHEVISKAGGDALRCSLATDEAGRWLELPVWMFDRGTCLSVRLAPSPWVDCAALLALKECVARALAGRLGEARTSNASDSGAERNSCNQTRGTTDATPAPSATRPASRRRAARPLRPAEGAAPGAGADLAAAAGRSARDRDQTDGAPARRPRKRRTPALPTGRAP